MSRFSLFVDGSEWLNDTMRLNGAFWMAIDNISKRSYSCAIAVWCVCKNTRVIWEIPANRNQLLEGATDIIPEHYTLTYSLDNDRRW